MGSFYAISDLHADFPSNFALIETFYHKNKTRFKNDLLIIAGDISHKIYLIEHVLSKFREMFKEVAYVYGNHELWRDRKHQISSTQKIQLIEQICAKNDIKITPFLFEKICIVPVYSWYTDDFATEEEKADPSLQGWADKYLCDFKKTNHELSLFFHAKNHPLHLVSEKIISFSHFLPRKDLLLPHQSFILFKGLSAVAGNSLIDQYIRSIGSQIHISGHTHINFDHVIDGIRYIQNSLKYPSEQIHIKSLEIKEFYFKPSPESNVK